MIRFHCGFRPLRTGTYPFADLNFADEERHFTLNFNGQSICICRIVDNIYDTSRIFHTEIIPFAAEADASALVSLTGLTVQERTSQ